MSVMQITAESLSREFNREVPQMYVIIAKHSILGMDSEEIRNILGCSLQDVQEVENDSLYKEVRIYVGAIHAQDAADTASGWDHIENEAIKQLSKRIAHARDDDFLLRVAAVANKAQRRQSAKDEGVLDPGKRQGRAAITLTQRLIQRLNRNGQEELIQERQVSISDGSVKHPTFDEVDDLLSVSRIPTLPKKFEIQAHAAEPTFEELDRLMQEQENRGKSG